MGGVETQANDQRRECGSRCAPLRRESNSEMRIRISPLGRGTRTKCQLDGPIVSLGFR